MLLLCLATASLPASAERWQDPDNTTFGEDVSLDNSADGLLTEFMIDSNRTTIGWQDLQQPEDNTLRFSFTNPGDQPTVLNYIGAQHPSNLNGRVDCNGCTVVFSNPYGVYIGNRTVIETGNLVMVAGEIDRQEFLSKGFLDARLEGIVQNDGQILADGNVLLLGREVVNNGEIQVGTGVLLMLAGEAIHDLDWDAITDDFLDRTDFRATLSGGRVENNGTIEAHDAALIGARIVNRGEITIADGSFLMLAADEVWIRRFDDPVTIRLPTFDGKRERTKQDVEYAIENHGRIDAGLGHVRLSAADPLGYGIRQGSGGSIAARKIELAGGEVGRVHLSGEISARDDSPEGVGGEIDITGSIIALVDATVDASGTRGGGTIQIGGEQEGRGELQRARSVIIDDASEVRADALSEGDGGRVIVFSEEFTSVDGELSARGGARGGDGGFIETSGLMRFMISETPDLSAPQGQAGDWLIDPFDITIRSATDVPACGVALECMNDEIEAILDPEFDDTAFADSIIRTIATSEIDAEVIAKALAVGTDVVLSTEAFGLVAAPDMGNITIASEIRIQNADTLASTTATFRLLAANHISVDADIVSEAAAPGEDPNLALDVILQANDLEQADPTASFSYELIRGDVEINANIETGGGDLTVHGVAIHQAAGSSILTNGGRVDFRSGSLDSSGNPGTLTRSAGDPPINSSVFAPASTTGYAPVAISIDGTVDTTDNTSLAGRGGNVTMSATGIDVLTPGSQLDVVTGLLTIDSGAVIATGGGSMTLAGGQQPAIGDQDFAGNVLVAGALNSSCVAGCSGDDADIGGAVSIDATHIDPVSDSGLVVQFIEADLSEIPARREGGQIGIDVGSNTLQTGGATLSIGGLATRTISIDGMLDTRRMLGSNENGLTSIVAFDELAVDEDALSFGDGLITIGANAATTLSSGGISIQARTVETSGADPVFANAVVLEAVGASSTALGEAVEDVLQIEGRRSLDFGINTRLEGETVQIAAATRPAELSADEQMSPAADAAELQFQGITGAVVDGVRINASTVSITVGDGTTSTSDLTSEPVDPMGVPFVRGSVGSYEGLQLASEDDTTRPDQITISQDGDLTIAATVTNGELSLESAFDTRAIGQNGMQLSLESADGVLTIEDATALNNTIPMAPVSPDDGKSWVTLLGGLLEVTSDPAVVFGSAGAPLSGAARFDVEALVVSTPGDFGVDSQIVDSILSVNDLAFEAGRNTGVEDTAESGDLTIGDATATVTLRAGERLSLRAGASGFGDLTFSPGAGQSIELHADDIGLRAGAGAASLNPDAGDLSLIAGLAQTNIAIRRADGSDFGSDTPGSNLAFRYQQDAAIDAAIDLPPDFAQFGTGLTNGFGLARDVVYSVRSDMGSIDLDDGMSGTNELDRFRNAALQLIGLEIGSTPAIIVSTDSIALGFEADSVDLGGVGDFEFTTDLAAAFNRTAGNSDPASSHMTLRSGVGGQGNLSFDPGTQASVQVTAARIDLVVGDGAGGETGSRIDPNNAEFDLSGAAPGAKIFVYQQDDETFDIGELPSISQFVGGASPIESAPDILAIRSDSDLLDLENLDFAALPIDTTGAVRRLILEADEIRLTQTDGSDLDLQFSGPTDLRLRLRTNDLVLGATDTLQSESGAKVLAGTTSPQVSGDDADFDAETLLIEAFDTESQIATVKNLSALSADANAMVEFDLADGRGPTSIAIDQNGSLDATNLPDRGSISGELGRTLNDDQDGNAVATDYSIRSRFGRVGINSNKVDGSNLSLVGTSGSLLTAADSAFDIAAETYDLAGLAVATEDSIVILDDTIFDVENSLFFAAAVIGAPDAQVTTPLGRVQFGTVAGAAQTIDLSANQIVLSAGPDGTLENPDGTAVNEGFLPTIVLDGLRQVSRTGDQQGSVISLEQSASLDLGATATTNLTDFLDATTQWETIALSSLQGGVDPLQVGGDPFQGGVRLVGFGVLPNLTQNLTVHTGPDGAIVADLEDQSMLFDDFDGRVLFASNDILFTTDDATTQLDLASRKLELRSAETITAFPSDDELSRIRDDPDALDRPIVRVHQRADFDTPGALPLPEQYTVEQTFFDFDGTPLTNTSKRTDLGGLDGLDIELAVTDPAQTLTLDNAIRDRAMGSNLILKSTSDVDISIDGAAAGFEAIDAAALPLSSLDIRTIFNFATGTGGGGGQIGVSAQNFPTTGQAGFDPPPPLISTTGDQRFDGSLDLQDNFVNRGRDIAIKGVVTTANGSGLELRTSGKVSFEDDIGSNSARLSSLSVFFDVDATGVPNVEFAKTTDQTVYVDGDIVFEANNATTSGEGYGVRTQDVLFASIGKALGNLTLDSLTGDFLMGAGEKLSVGGTAQIDAMGGRVQLGDVAALDLVVNTPGPVGLVRRESDSYLDRGGDTQTNNGPTIVANSISFNSSVNPDPVLLGTGKATVFGVPDPYAANLPSFLDDFALFEIHPGGRALNTSDFRFASSSGPALLAQIPALPPTGSSRSDLSGAFGPRRTPGLTREIPEPLQIADLDRLRALGIEARPTSNRVKFARLEDAAVIDDLGFRSDVESISVTDSRLDARDAALAIELYEELFGPEDDLTDRVREVLQAAVDRYLEQTRARRVIGFELRRFVKNRPSTMLEAFKTLESLDALFRYHRRLGLSPGEFRSIQNGWLRRIQPDGITLEELSEAIHPSRYVRGSDILDIFGR